MRFELTTLVVIGTDSIGSCKSNYHTITIKSAPCMEVLWITKNVSTCISDEDISCSCKYYKLKPSQWKNTTVCIKKKASCYFQKHWLTSQKHHKLNLLKLTTNQNLSNIHVQVYYRYTLKFIIWSSAEKSNISKH